MASHSLTGVFSSSTGTDIWSLGANLFSDDINVNQNWLQFADD